MREYRATPGTKRVKKSEIARAADLEELLPRLMTTDECARCLRLSPRTLEDMRLEGNGPPFVKIGTRRSSRVFYLVDGIEEWLLAQRHGVTRARSKKVPAISAKESAHPKSSQNLTQDNPALTDILTCTEASMYLRIPLDTMRKKRVDGSGPPFVKLGNKKRSRVAYRRSDLDAWLAAHLFKNTSEQSEE